MFAVLWIRCFVLVVVMRTGSAKAVFTLGWLWEKRFWKRLLCSSYHSIYGVNEYGNTSSLVSVGCGVMQDKVKIMCWIWTSTVSNCFCRLHWENKGCEVVPFSKYALLLPDSKVAIFIARFHWIGVNEQPKQYFFHRWMVGSDSFSSKHSIVNTAKVSTKSSALVQVSS